MVLAAGTRTAPADPPARDWYPGVGAMGLGLEWRSPRAAPDPFGVHDDHRGNSAAKADPLARSSMQVMSRAELLRYWRVQVSGRGYIFFRNRPRGTRTERAMRAGVEDCAESLPRPSAWRAARRLGTESPSRSPMEAAASIHPRRSEHRAGCAGRDGMRWVAWARAPRSRAHGSPPGTIRPTLALNRAGSSPGTAPGAGNRSRAG
jgi:hypothetical protein